MQVDENFIPDLVIIREQKGYVHPIRVKFVDGVILRIKCLSKNPAHEYEVLLRPEIRPHTHAAGE